MKHYIREWSENTQQTQNGMASEIGVDPSLVSRWMNGAHPSSRHLVKLGELYDVNPAALYFPPTYNWFIDWLDHHNDNDRHKAQQAIEQAFSNNPPARFDGYSRAVLISVIREMSDNNILPLNDDVDSIPIAFLELCAEHARKLDEQSNPLNKLRHSAG